MVTSWLHHCRFPRSFLPLHNGFILLLVGCLSAGCAPTEDPVADAPPAPDAWTAEDAREARTAIRALLDAQADAWNRGDIEAFMAGYARTDTLRFASGGDVRQGWQTTLDNYRKNYPNREAMGMLTFDRLKIDILSPQWAMAFGAWRLERAEDAPGGLFTLLLHNADAPGTIVPDDDAAGANAAGADTTSTDAPGMTTGWRIVYDHTSAARPSD